MTQGLSWTPSSHGVQHSPCHFPWWGDARHLGPGIYPFVGAWELDVSACLCLSHGTR